MEFQLHTNLDALAPIDFNFEQLKQELSENLKYYEGLIVTEESVKEAKSDKAKLNALRTAIDDKRKAVKKACMVPYEAFEVKAKELLSMIDAPILAIDGQVKSFEDAEKERKLGLIKAYYGSVIGDLSALLPFESIYQEKWMNVTVKMKEIQTFIDIVVTQTKSDLQTIADLHSEFELQIKDTYLKTRVLSAALNEKTRLEAQKAKLAEYEAKQEAERQADLQRRQDEQLAAATAPITETHLYHPEPPVCSQPEVEAAPVIMNGITKTIKVIFYDTTAAFRADMKTLTEKHGIQYGGIN